jgi:hypothetical protein
MGPDQTKDCRLWNEEKKESMGCGISCNCPGMKDGLLKYHKYSDLLKLYETEKIDLSEICDEDWFLIQRIIQEQSIYKIEKAEETERIQRLLGDKGNPKKRF